MTGAEMAHQDDDGSGQKDRSVMSFDPEPTATPEPSPEPAPLETEASDPESGSSRTMRTVLAILLSIGLGAATVIMADNVAPQQISTVNLIVLGGVASLVAAIGIVPIRWGWWVMATVTIAFHGLAFYNMAVQESTVFANVSGEAVGNAILGSGIGVVVGAALQGLYRLIAGE